MTAQTISTFQYDTLSKAHNFGEVVANSTVDGVTINRFANGWIGANKWVDYYRFEIGKPATVNVVLSNVYSNFNIRLVHDITRRSHVRDVDVILGSYNRSANDARLRIDGLGAGVYYLEISTVNRATAKYSLQLGVTPGIPGRPKDISGRTLAAAIPVVGQLVGTRVFTGSMHEGDVDDFYRFTLHNTVQFRCAIRNASWSANLYLYQDTNRNLQIDEEERINASASNRPELREINQKVLTPGTYYVQVQKRSAAEADNYILELSASPLVDAALRIDIHELKALAQFDPRVPLTNWHEADFFGTITIDGAQHKFGPIKDQNVVTGLKFLQYVNPNKRFIPVKIEIYDEDNVYHDRADIAPIHGAQSISFNYDTMKQRVMGTQGFLGTYKEGETIPLQGTGGDWTVDKPQVASSYAASINFSVRHFTAFFRYDGDRFESMGLT
jgi:hypothetical protein